MFSQWTRRVNEPRLTQRKLTLLGRAIALVAGELLFNAVCWIAAGICFGKTDGILGLALLAWTIGLRHGLDADHISAIDNATRQLVSQGQLPITCGLFFSLGHSTIVIVVNVAIAVSVDIYDKLDRVGSIGGIVGASVSASFLFLIACLNIYFLIGAIKQRRSMKRRQALGLPPDEDEGDPSKIYGGGCMVRVVGPILRAVDRPWKMYPVGVLFGFGFDTASSIALLAISAIAQRGPNGDSISHGKIVILPFLFTAGMSLVDSLDSILMLYAYATPDSTSPEGKLALLQHPDYKDFQVEETVATTLTAEGGQTEGHLIEQIDVPQGEIERLETEDNLKAKTGNEISVEEERVGGSSRVDNIGGARNERVMKAKANTMSSLSIILTLLSILVALSISLIEIMGLIGDNCTQCQDAANDPDGGGLAGSWWRAWARANDQSGYIGAAIVGCFAAILFGWYGTKWGMKKWKARKDAKAAIILQEQ
ncbi:high-affinity nickel-transporter [Cryptococcus deuterogattii 99/473]|uniref:Nickel/cobalt efflux system n=2 Tax=Cryptococcus deuterogattii TaxID=1859096 RepID=A0A0D0SXX1_9TREE|nr:high-affinity nickel-transporter [Cryptococcus deuterogattii R265]KIR32362.1 high-affinity nickel-transporter [Cryptococcus deuterogattii MMRL2647]KIR38017.1 high-affinity nickel-transporter [Cryptococcus deuterogattii Ram5]KIR74064.1 high-affinity nickel-transporter [Cryptococcus deuterogattii CA1014]KIR96766.1 high-affinity nickel-transporter [Cryptococcus deuterogattii 2001/935-1]KIY54516.1 high-affinity nickel-transporter [Cryptococcus deuterogattii 99/473]